MSGEILAAGGEDLWDEYLRLLRAAGRGEEADEAAGSDDTKFYATVMRPEWLRDRVEQLRRESLFTAAVVGGGALEQALRERRYPEAARLLPEALASTLDVLATTNLAWNTMPALTPAAIAVAALHPDEQVDAMFARLSALPNTPNVGAYSRVLDLRQSMRALLAAMAASPDRAAVKAASGLDGRAFTNTAQWLVKAGAIDDDGVTLRPATGAPATEAPTEQEPEPSGYRLPADPPQLIDLNESPRVAGPDMYDPQPVAAALSRVPEAGPALLPTPPTLRPAGQARLVGTRHTTWLLTMKRPVAELRPVWTATVFDAAGAPQAQVVLPAPATSWTAGPDRDWVCVVDEDAHLRVYREGGELIVDVDLGEVADDRRSHFIGFRPLADYDVTDDRLLVVSGPNVWLLRPDGDGWALRVPPKVYPSGSWPRGATPPAVAKLATRFGLREDLTTGEAVSHLAALGMTDRDVAISWPSEASRPTYRIPAARFHDHLGLITDDHIRAARLTRSGATISTSYGLNVDVADGVEVLRLWATPGTLTTLSEGAGSRVGVVSDAVVSVADDIVTVTGSSTGTDVALVGSQPSPVHDVAAADGEALALPNHVIRVSGSSVHIVNTGTGVARTYPLPKKPSAVVRAGDHVRVHVGAKHAEVPLP
ncbi:hypothetical protein ACWGJ9_08490 [Curtobacterium citreum]